MDLTHSSPSSTPSWVARRAPTDHAEHVATRLIRNALLAAAVLIAHRLLSPTVALAASKPAAGKPDLHKAAVAGRYGLLIAAGALIVPTVAAYLISRSRAEKDHEGPLWEWLSPVDRR